MSNSASKGTSRIVLLGPPGAGKGTQAEMLSREMEVPYIASGNLMRHHQEEESPLGRKIKGYTDQRVLVPDDIAIEMVLKEVLPPRNLGGFILDGFPRNIHQAEVLDESLSRQGVSIDRVVLIKIDELEELVRRLGGRMVCRRCQAPYNLNGAAPSTEGVCQRCGGELYTRQDDVPETTKVRIKVYEMQTQPLIEYYKRTGKLVEVQGTGSVDDVSRRLVEIVRAKNIQ